MSTLLLSPPARLQPLWDKPTCADGSQPHVCNLEVPQKEREQPGDSSCAPLQGSCTRKANVEWKDIGYPLSKQSLATLIQKETELSKCHSLYSHLTKIGIDSNVFFQNMALNMYGRCGAVEDAQHLFLCGPKDAPTWNAMISVFAQNGHHKDALQLFHEMNNQSVEPTNVTFLTILTTCNHPVALMDGIMIHALILEHGFEGNELLESALITMYGKCGSIEIACIMFHKLHHYNVISWTTMISILACNSLVDDAYRIFELMQSVGMSPSKITFLAVLSALHHPCQLDLGKSIHSYIVKYGFDSDCFLGTSLIKMYGESARLEDSQHVFNHLHDRNIVSWNALIDAYAQNELGERALQFFWEMLDQKLKADAGTYISALNACLSLESIMDGRAIHAHIKGTRFEGDVVVATALVNMYGRCGDLDEAQKVFECMCYRNIVSWNTLIGEYTEHGFGQQPLQFFYRMLEEAVMVNRITYLNILGACAILSAMEESRKVHARIWGSELKMDAALETALIHTYGKCGCLEEAQLQFDGKPERSCGMWGAMISVYTNHGHDEEALALFAIMQQEEVTIEQVAAFNAIKACFNPRFFSEGSSLHSLVVKFGFDGHLNVANALVHMYGKWALFEEAILLFHDLRARNVVLWNTLIGVYAEHGLLCEATQWIQKMKEDHVQPDKFTFISMLSACADFSQVEDGRALHAMIVNDGLEQCMDVGTTLISMYGKCGDLETSCLCFERMYEQGVMAWNSLLATYAHLGHGRLAYKFYLCMLENGPRPDAITFLSVLSACSHEGLFEEGLSCFTTMKDTYKVEPKLEHFGCMVDLYGRSGETKEAERFINRMQLEGHALVWRTLLGSCKLHNDVEVGRRAGERAIDLDPENPALYVLLSDLLAKNQMWKEIALLREQIIKRGWSLEI